jgi:NTE family protein
MPRVGLVLGAGGVVGQAYHAGVLAALELDLGWDPRTADVIVGSSAGSVTGALLRFGVSAEDLAAWAVDVPLSLSASELRTALEEGDREFPPLTWRDLLRRWRLPHLSLLARTARRPWALRPSVAAMTMVPAGTVDLESRLAAFGEASQGGWPDGLWICTVRRDDGGRVVFGRPGGPTTTVAKAVAASCAIPGYFAPVRIGDRDHLDGGVHSPTNADVLRHEDLDLVIVLSPMSASRGRSRGIDAGFRLSSHRRLRREVARLRARGTEVVRFEPSDRVLRVMGVNAMATDRAAAVVREALLDAGAHALRPSVAERLAPLVNDRAARGPAKA